MGIVLLAVVVVLIVLGVHSCQVSQEHSALRDYSDNVASVIRSSNNNGAQFFSVLSSSAGSSNASSVHQQLEQTRMNAQHQLNRAQGFDVPGAVKTSQQQLLLALQMREDGITKVAGQIEPALQPSTSSAAVNTIAAEMARFYASDVLYKDYALPGIVSALKADGIAVGGSNGVPVEAGQFLPSLQWLSPTFLGAKLNVKTAASASANCTPSTLRGHSLNSVSVGGTTLQAGATNTVPRSPPPVFTLTIGTGNMTETNVTLKVTVSGTSIRGQTVLPQTPANQSATGQVTLNGSPPPGNHTVTAEVVPVPCEEDTSNNTLTFPVTFQ